VAGSHRSRLSLGGFNIVKQLTSTERGALIAGVVLLGLGLFLIIWPQEMTIRHATNNVHGDNRPAVTEHVGKIGSRVYGLVAILFGFGFAAAGLCGGRLKP